MISKSFKEKGGSRTYEGTTVMNIRVVSKNVQNDKQEVDYGKYRLLSKPTKKFRSRC